MRLAVVEVEWSRVEEEVEEEEREDGWCVGGRAQVCLGGPRRQMCLQHSPLKLN